MKQIIHSYPTTAYILYLFLETNGKTTSIMPNPELFHSLSDIKAMMEECRNRLKDKNDSDSFNTIANIIPLELEDIYSYKERLWKNSSRYIKKIDVMKMCLPLFDNHELYRLVVTPCRNQNNNIFQTIQSVFLPADDKLVWYKLPHSNIPIEKNTKYVAIYKCGKPRVYDSKSNVSVELETKRNSPLVS